MAQGQSSRPSWAFLCSAVFLGSIGATAVGAFFVFNPDLVAARFTDDGSIGEATLGRLLLVRFAILGLGFMLVLLALMSILLSYHSRRNGMIGVLERSFLSLKVSLRGISSTRIEVSPRDYVAAFLCIVALGLTMRVVVGVKKSHLNVDEVLSLEFIAGNHVSSFVSGIDQDRYIKTSGTEITKHFSINSWSLFNFCAVNRAVDDVDDHPPLYYWLLHISQVLISGGSYSKWPGIVLNIVVYLCTALVIHSFCKMLFSFSLISLFVLYFFTISPASLGSSAFIRPYDLFILATLAFTFRMLKTLIHSSTFVKDHAILALTVSLGLLTHYFFIVYLFIAVSFSIALLCRKKEWSEIARLIAVIATGCVLSLLINPLIVRSVLFGGRGVEALSSTQGFQEYGRKLATVWTSINHSYFFILDVTVVLTIAMIVLVKIRPIRERKVICPWTLLMATSTSTLLLIVLVAPWQTPRYYLNLLPVFLIADLLVVDAMFRRHRVLLSAIIVLSGLLLPRFIDSQRIDNSVGSTYLYANRAGSLEGVLTRDVDTPVVTLVNDARRWSWDSLVPFLVKKKHVFVVDSRVREEALVRLGADLDGFSAIYLLTESRLNGNFERLLPNFDAGVKIGDLEFYEVHLLRRTSTVR